MRDARERMFAGLCFPRYSLRIYLFVSATRNDRLARRSMNGRSRAGSAGEEIASPEVILERVDDRLEFLRQRFFMRRSSTRRRALI